MWFPFEFDFFFVCGCSTFGVANVERKIIDFSMHKKGENKNMMMLIMMKHNSIFLTAISSNLSSAFPFGKLISSWKLLKLWRSLACPWMCAMEKRVKFCISPSYRLGESIYFPLSLVLCSFSADECLYSANCGWNEFNPKLNKYMCQNRAHQNASRSRSP